MRKEELKANHGGRKQKQPNTDAEENGTHRFYNFTCLGDLVAMT